MKILKPFLEGFSKGFKEFGHNITIIINTALLLLVYILGVGLTSVFAKLIRKRFLETKIEKDAKTYWSDINLKKKPIEEYYRQF